MTAEETTEYYKRREAYRERCADFRKELHKYLANYEPRNRSNLPQLRA